MPESKGQLEKKAAHTRQLAALVYKRRLLSLCGRKRLMEVRSFIIVVTSSLK